MTSASHTIPAPNLVTWPALTYSVDPMSGRWPSKVFALSAVIALHALLVVALMMSRQEPKQASVAQPIQIVSIDAPIKAEQRIAPLEPMPIQNVLTNVLSIAPEIDIAVETAASLTVTVAAAATSADLEAFKPKTVSIVDYVREPRPKYPSAARAMKQKGVVLLRALVDAQGHAAEVQVYRSSGFRLLDEAGREAVGNALFKPYTENGSAQPVYVLVPIEFGSA